VLSPFGSRVQRGSRRGSQSGQGEDHAKENQGRTECDGDGVRNAGNGQCRHYRYPHHFPSNEREVSVKLSNEGEAPGLVQAWVDNGDIDSSPESAKAPFVLTPPVFRVDPKKGQTMRLLYTREPLPDDRESVFWLNLLEVPPKPQDAEDSNFLQMAFRTRIKIFYRPVALNSVQKRKTP